MGDFKRANLAEFCPRVLFGLALYIGGLYTNCVSQAFLQQKMAGYYASHWLPNTTAHMTPTDRVILWDAGFSLFPEVSPSIANSIAVNAPLAFLARFCVIPGPNTMRWTILRRALTVWGCLWFIRSVSIVLTPLPSPDRSCIPLITFPNNIWLEGFMIILSPFVSRKDLTCQDLLFSGHTCEITVAALFYCEYSRRAPWFQWERSVFGITLTYIIGIGGLISGWYVITASRLHYTIDVFIAAILGILIYIAYHYAIRLAQVGEERRCSPFPFLRWYEAKSEDFVS